MRPEQKNLQCDAGIKKSFRFKKSHSEVGTAQHRGRVRAFLLAVLGSNQLNVCKIKLNYNFSLVIRVSLKSLSQKCISMNVVKDLNTW